MGLTLCDGDGGPGGGGGGNNIEHDNPIIELSGRTPESLIKQ